MKKFMTKSGMTVALLIAVFVMTALFAVLLGMPTRKLTAAADGDNTNEGQNMESVYEIYPTPHNIVYGGKSMTVTDDVKVEFGDDIDNVTKSHLYDALSKLDVVAKSAAPSTSTKVLVGVYGSGDEADKFMSTAFTPALDDALFEKIDAHAIFIGDNTIAVLGKDTDAAFYAISTLNLVFMQVTDRSIRELKVTDWSDSVYRGFIEGYYGVPWTTDERIELMRFGSIVKSNIYIYAPKDDPYHSSNWRGLYKTGDYAALKEQIKAGAETKTLFTWAIHPFMESSRPFTRKNFDADLVVLLAKLQQVYDAGVRQFMVSADDIMEESRDAACQRDLLNAVQDWLEKKGDCGNLIFVGSSYSGIPDATRQPYYAELMDGLDERVVVMWTGAKISSRMSNCAYDMFDELTGGRQPFIWMNWPVSDYCTSNLLLGAGEVFDLKVSDGKLPFSGVVVNPMQHAELSKISIFAAADYCWNVNGFDIFKSYEDSFKYIDGAEPQALRNLAVHMTNPNGDYDGAYFAESEELKRYIDRYTVAYEKGDYVTEAVNLSNQFDIIISASEMYEAGAENTALRDSIRPWSEGLKRMAEAAQMYLDLAVKIKDGAKDAHRELYNAAKEKLASVQECLCPVLGPAWQGSIVYNPVIVGPHVITPFVDALADEMTERVAIPLGIYTGVTVKGFPPLWSDTSLDSIMDGNPETYAHFAGWPEDGAFIRVDLGKPTEITKLRLLNGTPYVEGGTREGDDAIVGYIEYSENGVDYIKLCDITGPDTLLSLPQNKIVTARYVRIVSQGTYHYAALRELYINSLGGHTGAIISSHLFGILEKDPQETNSDMLKNIYDGDGTTVTTFNKDGREVGGYVQIDLTEEVDITRLRVLTGNNRGSDTFAGHIEASRDGDTFTNILTLTGPDTVAILRTQVKARYIRIVVDALPNGWMAIRELFINSLGGYDGVIVSSHMFGTSDKAEDEPNSSAIQNIYDGYDTTVAAFNKTNREVGGYVQIDLMEEVEISYVRVLTGKNNGNDTFAGHVEISLDGDSFTDIGSFSEGDSDTELRTSAATRVRYIRIVVDALPNGWMAIREVKIG
ncbi:MAG: beta-N-acetylglucosaminidase domain-containing protein [Clostridiales bacterium]|nr:beta-N-acetylglucosaminidase domain-containing protein [Clostridiales bacterium]